LTDEEYKQHEKGNNILVIGVCIIVLLLIGLTWSLILSIERVQDANKDKKEAESNTLLALTLNNLTIDYLDECVSDYKILATKYKILEPQEYYDIENCTDVMIYSEINQDETCVNQFRNKTLTDYDSIINLCEQDMLVYCKK
jgi:hypothetical protein